jgi:NTE family protein
MALTTLRRPRRHSPGACLAGWLPRGFVSTEPVSRLVETIAGPGWPAHPNLWVMATDYGDGRRGAFGRAGAPRARIADAVAASCAIPGFYHPVAIGRRRYVDGGVCSVSNLDVLCGRGLDLVVCLSPSSSLAPLEGRTPWARMAAIARAQAGRRLGHEARKLRAEGTEVLLVQPAAEDLVLMGSNPMARTRRVAIAELAVRTTTRDLRARRTELEALRLRRRRVASAPQTARRAA